MRKTQNMGYYCNMYSYIFKGGSKILEITVNLVVHCKKFVDVYELILLVVKRKKYVCIIFIFLNGYLNDMYVYHLNDFYITLDEYLCYFI